MKQNKMKLFAVAAFSAIALISCGSGETKETTADTTAATSETAPAADTVAAAPATPATVVDIAVGSADHTTLVAAVKAAEFIKYEGAGTVEFLVDKHRNFYFMEMNTRIQVEHPITEQVIDYDLIREQIMVAAGIPISGKNYLPQLHAIEVRINAEDPYNDFRPSPGKITTLHMPGGHGVRLDTHAYAGYTIPPNYDSMIAKLITVAQTREEAILKMKRALDEYIIEGVKTTIPFHQKLMENEDFKNGNFTTKFMETFEF
jgi:acetyl-CoA carboxylase biotin carboxylase subunit